MSKKTSNRLFTNMLSYAVLQIVNMLVGIFLPRLYLEVYGSEINGIVSTVNSFTTYFSYLEAGLGLTLIHSLFKPIADNDTGKMNNILSFSKKQYQKISYIYFALVVALSVTFPFLRVAEDIGKIEFMLLVFVIGVYGAMDFYTMAKYRVLLTADRKEYVISNAMILAQLLRFVFVFFLLNYEISITVVKIVPIFTLLVRSIILKIYVKRAYPEITFASNSMVKVPSTSSRWDALLLQISISTSVSLPTIIISQVLGFREANVFAVYSLVISAMIAIISALSSGVSPMFGKSMAEGKNIREFYDIYEYIVSFIITAVFSVTAVMIIPFIKLYTNVVDDINYIYPLYAVLISVWAALYSYRIPLTAVINAAAIYKENRIHNFVNLALQILFGVIFTVIWGIPGILIVMIISALHRNISMYIENSKKVLHNKISKCILIQIVMSAIIIFSFAIGYGIVWDTDMSFGIWICGALFTSLITFALCVIVFSFVDYNSARNVFSYMKKKICK